MLNLNDPSPIFRPVSPDFTALMQRDELSLHTTFWVNNNKNQEVHVVLSTDHLAICQKNAFDYTYLYSTEIDFDLKFEVVYLAQDHLTDQQNSIFSTPVGFRLMKQDAMTVEFEIVSRNLLPIWLKYFRRMMNQVGFHKLFKPLRKLGKGGFATVYEVERLTDGKLFAVKAFSKQNTICSKTPSHRLSLLNQIKMMRSIDHPNLIKLEGIFESQNSLYVVLQLMNCGHLHKEINGRGGRFSLDEVKVILGGLVKALRHLHQQNILHRDIKPENIMLKSGLVPVLVDFGLAASAESEDYIFYRCGTPGYVAPQVTVLQKGQKISPVCDVFSMGVIFHILLTARPLFTGKQFEQVYNNNKNMVFNLHAPEYDSIDPEAMDLLQQMLKANPENRITASQIMQHPFLAADKMDQEKPSPSSSTTLKAKTFQKAY